MNRLALMSLLPLAAAACAPYARDSGPDASRVPAARIVGEPVSCVPLQQFSETRVRDDYTIDFMRNGRQGWRNTLPNRCSGLTSENAFTYETSLSQLCNTDIVYPLHTAGGLNRGAGCGLGQFVPIELER